ncbi:PIG-L deacetylase family protein [Alkalihalobacillus sp. CinArs1]|uniref:PIG-L deacetylase family protein n=1 Tax=Alkalihalobacillus sp. CinArs1 TaxID=2995314 RepID=UPI0022DD8E7C|nr:PIG-L deacetylase family protein [Alkalihalobacillus sp. CinArs1]
MSSIKKSIRPIAQYVYGFKVKRSLNQWIKENELIIKERNHLVDSFSGERMLVLAPHVDDEIIGCGGAILQSLEEGKEVHIAFLTDGRNKGSKDNAEDIIAERKEEAIDVARSIGVPEEHIHFLDAEDTNLVHEDLSKPLYDLFTTIKPNRVFLPVLIDTHIDHYAVSIKLFELYEEHPEVFEDTMLMIYEVQSPISPLYSNCVLDITTHMDKKRSLLTYYKSQNTTFKFLPIMNEFNGALLDGGKYAELYIEVSPDVYMDFISEHFQDITKYKELKSNLVVHIDYLTTLKSYDSVFKTKQLLNKINKAQG